MAAPTVNKLVESFDNPHIPLIKGEPTYATLHGMHDLLNSNAASVATKLGCGTLGHLCLTLPPTVYATPLTTRVAPPLNPGAMPVILSVTTIPEAASIWYANDAARLDFNTFANVDRALRQWRRRRHVPSSAPQAALWVQRIQHAGYAYSRLRDI